MNTKIRYLRDRMRFNFSNTILTKTMQFISSNTIDQSYGYKFRTIHRANEQAARGTLQIVEHRKTSQSAAGHSNGEMGAHSEEGSAKWRRGLGNARGGQLKVIFVL